MLPYADFLRVRTKTKIRIVIFFVSFYVFSGNYLYTCIHINHLFIPHENVYENVYNITKAVIQDQLNTWFHGTPRLGLQVELETSSDILSSKSRLKLLMETRPMLCL